jgi:acyl-CoA dehydrogenase
MTYQAPVADMVATMRFAAGFDALSDHAIYSALTPEDLATILREAGRFASEVIAPLNVIGDRHGAQLRGNSVRTAPGWREAYRQWCDAGWNTLAGPASYGGQEMPTLLAAGCTEIWNSASAAFGLGPLLTMGAVEALASHGSEELRRHYLPHLVAGDWMGTMNLTEPQAGSDLSNLRTRAERVGDGTYRIKGSKIFISYGDHDLAENVVHLVLARPVDATSGTRGASLFLVPKILPDGSANDLRCAGLEHKLGLHGSPTCTMAFGDGDGATGWLIGEENRGLACMFTMMNSARLNVGLQGVGVAERAYQAALAYARDRRQGRAGGNATAIIGHPDVKRMLLTMKSLTAAARAICYLTARCLDETRLVATERDRAAAAARAALLTPVAKAFSTDIANEVASLGVQVHGGMGYIEETGAAQHMRDARVLAIYEGTNGIQAIDLVTRKLPLDGGRVVRNEISAMRSILCNADEAVGRSSLTEALAGLERVTDGLGDALASNRHDEALAHATPYLKLFGITLGGVLLAQTASAGGNDLSCDGRVALSRFFADQIATAAAGIEASFRRGHHFVTEADLALAG